MVQAIDEARRRPRQSAPRVPPHNLDAEQSLLGAMLLSRDAIAAAVEFCRTDDFYKPGHAHVFDAITTLYSRGEPADPVTVADELSRAGLLEAAGGLAALVSLQADTPATTNAGRYAQIVEEHALLRKLISVAGEIAEVGYSVPEDVTAAVDQAEAMVFDIAERRVTDTLKPLQSLLMASLDRLESLYTRGETITGVPTGYVDLDERLYGLQPSSLVIVGARPAMGKALALDTRIPTPEGWTTMGEIRLGERVFDESGLPCRVTYTSPIYTDRICYRVEFDDGSSLVADAEHQWFADDRRNVSRVVTTQQMVDEGVREQGGRHRWFIPVTSPLQCEERELPVDPYVLGCWLGDGHTRGSGMTLDDDDVAHFRAEFEMAGYPLVSRGGIEYSTSPGPGERALDRELKQVGLLGSSTKYIPEPYMRASFKQRLSLLQGILDTDGHANLQGGAELCLAKRRLIDDVRELVCSLGHKPGRIKEKRIRLLDGRTVVAWRFTWTPLDPVFRLERKAQRLRHLGSHRRFGKPSCRAVASIRPVESVPVRCITVDSPSHLYLAGESMIPTHNTAFALGMAAHAAVEARIPTLIFSLEMGHEELTQRLLVSEARVDSGRIRNGRLTDSDWPKISQAVARLSDAPLFIDDNPNLTVMEIRAKARRLKAREGRLGLIVVDYLQLMSSRSSVENRQLEVSSISRGLKVLARELEVPVVALSQLSRNLEMRADKRPMLADLRESGCMPASTRLLRADTGEEVTLGELVLSQEQPLVWSLDDATWKLVPRRLTNAFPSGIKMVYRLRLRSGYEVEATANHKFRTVDGWHRLDELHVRDHLATPRRVEKPLHPATVWSDDELILLAHLLGDGSIGPNGVKYATADPANKQAVEDTCRRLFGIEVAGKIQRNTWLLWLPSPRRLTHGVYHPVRNWLEPHGLWGSRSHDKFIPESILGLSERQVSLFLRHLWATDGSITLSRNGRGPTVRVYYATTSRRLADGVRRALLRLGIRSRISPARKAGYRICWHVHITSKPDQEAFLSEVGCHGRRGQVVEEALRRVRSLKGNPNVDLIPHAVIEQVRRAMSTSNVTHRQLASALGEEYCGSYLLGSTDRPRRFSRDRLSKIAATCGDAELSALATSDVFWDEIVEITPIGIQPTFDATVDGTHNFLANGVIAHNSLEQDADVVLFLYRDEMYNPDSADRGTAEVIVAKHRNGPTGKCQLAFLDHHTRFANMARV